MMQSAIQLMTKMEIGEAIHQPTGKSVAEHRWTVATTALLLWPEGVSAGLLVAALWGEGAVELPGESRAILRFADSYQRLYSWFSDESSVNPSHGAVYNIQQDALMQMALMPEAAQARAAEFLTLNLLEIPRQ